MQAVQRCNCSVRALEVFVKEFAGLEMRQHNARRPVYRQLRKPASNTRLFGTRSAFGIQQSFLQRTNVTSTAPNVDDALDSVSAAVEQSGEDADVVTKEAALGMAASQVDIILLPLHQTSTTPIDITQQRLDILGPSQTRTDGRKERKNRRIEAKKAAEEEAKQQIVEAKQAIVAAKKKQRRETAKKNAAKLLPQAKAEEEVKWQPREAWMRQKAALQDKFGEQKWQPRKRISPDALSGIRTMHNQQPHVYTTEVLAEHFKVSAEAIRRILKSKWQPDEEATDDRRRRWEKRGEKKWKEMVELGIRPPKKWRDMGVGKVGAGEVPAWKKGGHKTGAAGERWIEHPEADSFVVAGDMVSERADTEPSIGDRIL